MKSYVSDAKKSSVDFVDLPAPQLAEIEAGRAASAGDRLKADIVTATEERLNAFARSRNYDGILSACTYASDSNPVFAAEGQRCVDLRGRTWAKLYSMLAEVEGGTRPIPGSFDDIVNDLPALEWED